MAEQYLILEPDGSRATIHFTTRAGVERMLAEASDFSANGGYEPEFLREIPAEFGMVDPGRWEEGHRLILKVEVVVPKPVTTKWAI